ncbi:glycoside hydrolase family 127 protein [Flammeovirga kamogawensis]|uniref:Glycoside hydrolase family 127 protein n=1 Tax=Flammeovirga kamogawensis TaxID=373891 RepID=A0ABX8H051_9BACT|nr:beta-L-arabinofuranosidase domain-containing protein [Flammeovirga kamogawensis]MBB6463652.1 hypothetical protein [Flammeovirga kamogawensis]QWG09265.1 glycoside hydrolase family 127 protein [Flammeovirga kamogawensis]
MNNKVTNVAKKLAPLLISLAVVTGCKTTFGDSAASKNDYPVVPVPFNKVKMTDEFWQPRLVTERDVTVPFSLKNGQEAIDRLKMCGDFRLGKSEDKPSPHRFISSDLFKVMEGAAYSLMTYPNEELEVELDSIIDLIGNAMQDDGYLYISHTCGNPNLNEMGEKPYSWLVHSHELYNVGHMYEGAVAYYEATGKDRWLKMAEKNAQHVNKVFFVGGDPNYNDGKPINQAPGHQEIELALCKLYRATNNELYLDMAKKFLDIRGVTYTVDGTGVMSPTYGQQHAPVAKQFEPAGHAVRAAYQYCAMADVDALTGRSDYKQALDSIWDNLVNTRMHITGGLGAVHGIEGFGAEYELPNKDAYNETCAAVSNVFFNHRMFLLTKDAKYLDIAELSLFNNALAGINLAGNAFFYVNPLEADGISTFNHGVADRAKWFGCACCPPNISRMILQAPGYMYAHTDKDIYLSLYAGSEAEIPLADGSVNVIQDTKYPFSGDVKVEVIPEKETQEFAFKLRIPTWAKGKNYVPGKLYPFITENKGEVTVKVNGKTVDYDVEQGFAVINREWTKGDVLELSLPMEARYVDSFDKIEANEHRVAVVKGPLVYCAEEPDNDVKIQNLFVPSTALATIGKTANINQGVLEGIPSIQIKGKQVIDDKNAKDKGINLIPYYAWSNRGAGKTMSVWLPDNQDLAVENLPSIKYLFAIESIEASFVEKANDASIEALCDGAIPGSSADRGSLPRWSTFPEVGKKQWATINFKETKDIRDISVYWADRSEHNGSVKKPKSWNVEYKKEGKWHPFEVYITDGYRTALNQFNVIHPASDLNCDAIRINVTPYPEYAVGILETQITFGESSLSNM